MSSLRDPTKNHVRDLKNLQLFENIVASCHTADTNIHKMKHLQKKIKVNQTNHEKTLETVLRKFREYSKCQTQTSESFVLWKTNREALLKRTHMRQYKYQNQQKESEAETTHEQLNWRLGGFQDPTKNHVRDLENLQFFENIVASCHTADTNIHKMKHFQKKIKVYQTNNKKLLRQFYGNFENFPKVRPRRLNLSFCEKLIEKRFESGRIWDSTNIRTNKKRVKQTQLMNN